MEAPQIEGYEINTQIGSGSAGVVYLATRKNGSRCAIKVLGGMSSNPGLMSDRIQRVFEANAQSVIVPITARELEARPAWVIMDFLSESEETENPVISRTLQSALNQYLQNDSTWPFLQNLASALAKLHSASVAHGNLKPGNVFFGQGGSPLLADFASGLMPGVHRPNFSDALLYSPPEQLRFPNGYEGEAGYRWDVYAFGVIAYRLLTGAFPRSDKLFKSLCPAPGENQRFDIEVDHEGIASGLEQEPKVSWPDESVNGKEKAFRKVVNTCLQLDPRRRPFNMREVARKFGVIEIEFAQKEERKRLEYLKIEAERKHRGVSRRFVSAFMILLVGWGITQLLRVEDTKSAEKKFFDYRQDAQAKEADLVLQRDAAIRSEGEALRVKQAVEMSLAQEKRLTQDGLRSTQETNEKLFDWLLEEGIDGLPVLEERTERLTFLLKEIGKQLESISARPQFAEQARILKLRRAELGLATGDLDKSEIWLEEAFNDPMLSSDLAARAKLRYLLLASKWKPSALKDFIFKNEPEILAYYQGGGAVEIRVKAALALVKARVAESSGDSEGALASYLESLERFQELEKLHPNNTNIGFMVGRSYLLAARVAEGSSENAVKLRGEAAEAFITLAKKEGDPTPETQYQISSAKASQAVVLWQRGDLFGAEKLAREGVSQLISLQRKMPGDARVAIDLAGQQAIIATTLRDQGKTAEARSLLMEGGAVLEKVVGKYPENWSARYLLASLKWQLSGIIGQQGDGDEELRLGVEARDGLEALLKNPKMKRPRPSEVRKSMAYLCGDLGHAFDRRNKRSEAILLLQECKKIWQELKQGNGDQLEIDEGYGWAVNRLTEMGVK